MDTVANILSRKNIAPVTISPDKTVIEALHIMAEKNIGSLVVMNGDQYAGILTERDYSRKIVLKGRSSTDTLVSEIMSTDFPRVHASDAVEHCMQLMTDKNLRYLPVFENERLTGIISMSDVVKQTILSQKQTIDHLQTYISS
jgi:CBS domain-containing protein